MADAAGDAVAPLTRASWDDVTKWAFNTAWETALAKLTPGQELRSYCGDVLHTQLHFKLTSSGNAFVDGSIGNSDPVFRYSVASDG